MVARALKRRRRTNARSRNSRAAHATNTGRSVAGGTPRQAARNRSCCAGWATIPCRPSSMRAWFASTPLGAARRPCARSCHKATSGSAAFGARTARAADGRGWRSPPGRPLTVDRRRSVAPVDPPPARTPLNEGAVPMAGWPPRNRPTPVRAPPRGRYPAWRMTVPQHDRSRLLKPVLKPATALPITPPANWPKVVLTPPPRWGDPTPAGSMPGGAFGGGTGPAGASGFAAIAADGGESFSAAGEGGESLLGGGRWWWRASHRRFAKARFQRGASADTPPRRPAVARPGPRPARAAGHDRPARRCGRASDSAWPSRRRRWPSPQPMAGRVVRQATPSTSSALRILSQSMTAA